MQQDAEEFFSSIMGAAATQLRGDDLIGAAFHREKCGEEEKVERACAQLAKRSDQRVR